MATTIEIERVPRPIEVGPEMDALARFFPPSVKWDGVIHENGMGAGSPRMSGKGLGSSVAIQDGRWIAGDHEQEQFTDDGRSSSSGNSTGCAAGPRATGATAPAWWTTTAMR
jgi:hypothetical protein